MKKLSIILLLCSCNLTLPKGEPERPATRDCTVFAKRGIAPMEFEIAAAYNRCMQEKMIDMQVMELEAKACPNEAR